MNKELVAVDVYGKYHPIQKNEIKWRPSAYGIVIGEDGLLVSPQRGIGFDLANGRHVRCVDKKESSYL